MKPSSVMCKLMVWNVWSIANAEKLSSFLQIMDDQKIGIACITETWFDRKNGPFTKTIRDAGFEINHAFRENKRGGGSAIIYKKELSVIGSLDINTATICITSLLWKFYKFCCLNKNRYTIIYMG